MSHIKVWRFLRFLWVICCNRCVLSEGQKNYFKDWYLMKSQPTFLILIKFFTERNDYFIKTTQIRELSITQLFKNKFYQYSSSSFKFWWMWIFPRSKLSRYSCSIWDKFGWPTHSDNFSKGILLLIWKDCIIEILQFRAKFQTLMVSCSIFIWITNSSGYRRIWMANLLYKK